MKSVLRVFLVVCAICFAGDAFAQGWWGAVNQAIPEQTGLFTVEFDVVPRDSSVFRTHITLSQVVPGTMLANGWHDNAIIIRFVPDSRVVDARNSGTYAAVDEFMYYTDESYHIRMVVDVGSQSYDAYINTLPDGAEAVIAEGYGFRTEAVDGGLGDVINFVNVTIPYTDPATGVTDSGSELKNIKIMDADGNVVWEDEGTEYDPSLPMFPPTMQTGPFPFGTEAVRNDAPVDTNDPNEVIHEYTAYKGTVVVDGQVDDPAWVAIPWTLMEFNLDITPRAEGSLWDPDYVPMNWDGWEDLSTWFKVIHDDDNIYIAFMRYDDDYNFVEGTDVNDGNIWQNDAYQFIIDTRFPFDFEEEMPGAEIGVCQVDELEVYHFWSTANQNPAVQLELAEGDNTSGLESTDGKAIHGTIEFTDTGYREALEMAFVKYDDMYDDMTTMFSVCALDRDFDVHESVNQWAQGIFAKTVDEYGSILWSAQSVPLTSVEAKNDPSRPTSFALKQNYPNPFNPVTTISYDLSSKEVVTLNVFNVRGEHVATLVHQQAQSPGSYSVTFDASDLSSGIYFYQLQTSSQVFTQKMTLVR